MARLLLCALVATALLLPSAAGARGIGDRHPRRQGSASAAAATNPTTDPVALALRLAERYWHGAPACGTPAVVSSPHELQDSAYETVTAAEPKDSVVEMWTELQTCTITINASLWAGWRQDDESFQWFCDAVTHEVGHLFGHLDSGQTNPALITYPFLSAASPNFNSVPQCRNVTVQYGAEAIRNEETVHRPNR